MTKKSLDERVKNDPWLKARIEAIIDIAEGDTTGTETADVAEERVIAEIRKLGSEVMSAWAKKTSDSAVKQHQANTPGARPVKKNSSTGTRLSG